MVASRYRRNQIACSQMQSFRVLIITILRVSFVRGLSRHLTDASADLCLKTFFLFQRLSIVVQRFECVLVHHKCSDANEDSDL